MPWTPQNDFEEEILNLQPDHDFIFGYLSEPQYPRPTAHTECVATRKLKEKEERKGSEANSAISSQLHVIRQVQRIANIKPLGEHASIDDWDSNENLERETIGLMRHFGLSASVEQPLNEKVTIASHPVSNTNRVIKNGRRSVPLFLDDNMFKLRERVSDSSSGFESCNNSDLNKLRNDKDDSFGSEAECTSLNTSSASFNTATEFNDSFSSTASYLKAPTKNCSQYDKLPDDSSLSLLNCSKSSSSSQQDNSGSLRNSSSTAWVPVLQEDEVPFTSMKNWPSLSKKNNSGDINSTETYNVFNSSDTIEDNLSQANNTEPKRANYLDQLLKSIKIDSLDTTAESNSDSTSTTSSQKPITTKPPKSYASVTKVPKSSPKKKESSAIDYVTTFPPFYTTRKMYALKRNSK